MDLLCHYQMSPSPSTYMWTKKEGIVKGKAMQTIGPWKRLVVYLSKRLNLLAAGWPPCLCIIVTTPLLIKDSVN